MEKILGVSQDVKKNISHRQSLAQQSCVTESFLSVIIDQGNSLQITSFRRFLEKRRGRRVE